MHMLETAANLAARPFGLDFRVEKWCAWSDFGNYQFGYERHGGRFPAVLAWVGPLHFAASRT